MRIIYIDSEFKCYVTDATGRTSVETDYFDGKCDEYIEGYRFVPEGETWTREDGVEFMGEMASPRQDSLELERIQGEYERQQLAEAHEALAIVGVTK